MAINKMKSKNKSWMIEWDLKRKTTGRSIKFVMFNWGICDVLAYRWKSRNDIDGFKWFWVRWFFTSTDEKGPLIIRSFVRISGCILMQWERQSKKRYLEWKDKKKQLQLQLLEVKWKWLLFQNIGKWQWYTLSTYKKIFHNTSFTCTIKKC